MFPANSILTVDYFSVFWRGCLCGGVVSQIVMIPTENRYAASSYLDYFQL